MIAGITNIIPTLSPQTQYPLSSLLREIRTAAALLPGYYTQWCTMDAYTVEYIVSESFYFQIDYSSFQKEYYYYLHNDKEYLVDMIEENFINSFRVNSLLYDVRNCFFE